MYTSEWCDASVVRQRNDNPRPQVKGDRSALQIFKMAHPTDQCLKTYKYSFKSDILANKVAFISGGGSGICFRITEIYMR